jgi:hypothetical protein
VVQKQGRSRQVGDTRGDNDLSQDGYDAMGNDLQEASDGVVFGAHDKCQCCAATISVALSVYEGEDYIEETETPVKVRDGCAPQSCREQT